MPELPQIKLKDIEYKHIGFTQPFSINYTPPHKAQFLSIQKGSINIEIGESGKKLKVTKGAILLLIGSTPIRIYDGDKFDRKNSSSQIELGSLNKNNSQNEEFTSTILLGSTAIDANVILPIFPSVFLIEPNKGNELEEINLLLLLIQKEHYQFNEIEQESIVRRASEIITILLIRIIKKHLSDTNPNWPYVAIDNQITKAIKIMETDLSRKWTIEDLASKVGICRSSFSIRFRESVGDTPANYLSKLRINEAAAILTQGRRSVSDIARAVGYNSELGFTKAFRKEFSLTPSQYRTKFKANI